MPYIQRDEKKRIKGLFANPQPDYAKEFLPDNDKDVVDYLKSQEEPSVLQQLATLDAKRIRAISDVILGTGDVKTGNGKTPKQILVDIEVAANVLRKKIK